jgi:hypothetical protein
VQIWCAAALPARRKLPATRREYVKYDFGSTGVEIRSKGAVTVDYDA